MVMVADRESGGGMPAPQAMGLMDARFRRLADAEVDRIAEVCHEANRQFRRLIGEDPGPSWLESPEEQRASVREGVRSHAGEGGKLSKFMGSEDALSHERWMERKLREGWRYGTTKDPVAKTHPNLLPYRALPPDQRRKDVLFVSIVSALDPRREV